MIRFRSHLAADLLGGTAVGADVEFTGISRDSRDVVAGQLYAALPGERVDGHDFAGQAMERGATAILVNRELDIDCAQIVVPDVLLAMGRLTAAWRAQQPARIIGITGSNGKTTVKEMLASILSVNANTLMTEGNYNNELGLPLTLSRLSTDHQYAVLELGAGKPGDIEYLASIASPSVAIVNNAGPAHLERLGTIEGVAREKGSLFASLPPDGIAILNADQPWQSIWQEQIGDRETLRFGMTDAADIRGSLAGTTLSVSVEGESFDVNLPLPGNHNAMNALAATAAAIALGVHTHDIKTGLESVNAVAGRLNLIETSAGWALIDDTYNANPASLYAGLRVLSDLNRESWLVLGDMLELGEDSYKLHAEMGGAAADLGVRRLMTVGELSEAASERFGTGATHFATLEPMIERLKAEINPGVTCLIKGSRSMGMEAVVDALIALAPEKEAM